MTTAVDPSARIFRVRTEFVAATRELRVHVLCECGSGGWIASIAPFPDLFFDESPLIGQTVEAGLAWLARHYGRLDPVGQEAVGQEAVGQRAVDSRRTPPHGARSRKTDARNGRSKARSSAQQLGLAIPHSR